MARRRGFIAEMQHQQRLAEQRARREQAAATRAHQQAVREAEAAQRRADSARKQAAQVAEKERKQAEKEAKALYKAQMTALADARTADYERIYDEIDNLLGATLDVDDYVDLSSLKTVVEHPAFEPGSTAAPLPLPQEIMPPSEPIYYEPPAPKGFKNLFGGKTRHREEVARAKDAWQEAYNQWQQYVYETIPAENAERHQKHEREEKARQTRLARMRKDYESECEQRERMAAEHNSKIDDLIRRLRAGEEEAIDEYIGIVLANSVYPENFPVTYDYRFDGDLDELILSVEVPRPEEVPTVKHIKYVATADELRETQLSKTEQKQRYNMAVFATALRTFHEVFEADRPGYIASISLTVFTDTVDSATGHETALPLVLAAAGRESFMQLNLSGVEPEAALKGLKALLSKNPYAGVAAPAVDNEVRR